MKKQDAKKQLMEKGRYNFTVEFATEISKAFGLDLDKSLIRTTRGYRENIVDETEPRVNCCSLAENIAKRLDIEPDKEQYELSCRLSGAGSWRDAESKAYAMNL